MLITLLIAPMFIYFALALLGDLFSSPRSSGYKMPTEIEKREQERYEWLNSGLRY